MKLRVLAALLLCCIPDLGAAPAGKHFIRNSGALTAPSSQAPRVIAAKFIGETASLYGVGDADLPSVYLVREYKTEHNGVTHLVYRQRYGGVDVAHSHFVVNVAADGSIINAGGRMYPAPPNGTHGPAAESLSASIRAAMHWADAGAGDYTPIEVQGGSRMRRFSRSDGRGDIEGRAIWYPLDGRLQRAWEFSLEQAAGGRAAVIIDSETQTLLEARPLTFYQEPAPPRGLVFLPNPQPNPRPGVAMTEPPPYADRVLVSFVGDPQASPAGWVEGTETAGNNVVAGRNPLGVRFLVQPITAQSETRDFQFPVQLGPGAPNPTNFPEAAAVNLFYWMNRAHDMFWHIGFNEAAGNYQKQNFGRGGIEGDPVYAYAQFGVQQTVRAGLNNAFYSARGLEDGSPAMIAMYIGAGANGVFSDGSYDAEVIVHEYTHGVSLRLVHDLDGFQGGAMGEAWSDFFALEFTVPEGAPPDGVYPTGDYLFQRFNVGIRPRPYSTDINVNPVTFADMGRVSQFPEVHWEATIWTEALWEMRANLIRQFGEREGRRRLRLLVIDGMKLSVPSPTMVDARDAILLADRVDFKGESQTQIWVAFAKRGLGVTAFSRSPESTNVTASFAAPSNTGTLAFSEDRYYLGDTIRIILHDANLTGDVALVQVTSAAAGDLETVRLRREGAIYTAMLGTSTSAAAVREN
ncbi:MAG TPA: M36 family metallopeptidase, partial [Bryobacteraceae bacterium]|nr:M36 family metallopeptidase [Bryobacteraceae bacterium]